MDIQITKLTKIKLEESEILYQLLCDFDDAHVTKDSVAESLREEKEIILVARQGSTPVGFICGALCHSVCHKEVYGDIVGLFVEDQYRKTGIGQRLMEALEKEFRSLGIRLVTVSTSPKNKDAQNLYTRCGYTGKQRSAFWKGL